MNCMSIICYRPHIATDNIKLGLGKDAIFFPAEVELEPEMAPKATSFETIKVSKEVKRAVLKAALEDAGYGIEDLEGETPREKFPLYEGCTIYDIDPEFWAYVTWDGEFGTKDMVATEEDVRSHREFVARKKRMAKGKALGLPIGLEYLAIGAPDGAIRALVALAEEQEPWLFERNSSGFYVYWDSMGVWGMNASELKAAWFKCGCGQNLGYFRNILNAIRIIKDKYGRVDGCKSLYIDPWGLPKKYLTTGEILKWAKIKKWANDLFINLSNKLVWRMIKLPFHMRKAIMSQLEKIAENRSPMNFKEDHRGCSRCYPVYGPKAIDWEILHVPARVLVQKVEDKAYQWYWYAERLGIKIPSLVEPKWLRRIPVSPFELNKAQMGLFVDVISSLIERAYYVGEDDDLESWKEEFDSHHLLGVVSLIIICGKDIKAFRKIYEAYAGDLGSLLTRVDAFRQMHPSIRSELKGLLLKDERYLAIASKYQVIREALGRAPKSFEEAMKVASAFDYEGVIDLEVAQVASEAGLSQRDFEEMQEKHLKLLSKSNKFRGQFCALPENVKVEAEGYKVAFLPRLDPHGWALGEYTNCCQSLWSAGRDCAISGMERGDMGFLIVWDGDTILAQSWVWTDGNGHIVLDSIESKGLSESQINRVAAAIKSWAEKALETIFVEEVLIGITPYGYTKPIMKLLQKSKKDYHYAPVDYDGYMDGKKQRRIL